MRNFAALVALIVCLIAGCRESLDRKEPKATPDLPDATVRDKHADPVEAGPCDDRAKRLIATAQARRDGLVAMHARKLFAANKRVGEERNALSADALSSLELKASIVLSKIEENSKPVATVDDLRQFATIAPPIYVGMMGRLTVPPQFIRRLPVGLLVESKPDRFIIEGMDDLITVPGADLMLSKDQIFEVTGLRVVEHGGNNITAYVLRPYDVADAEACLKSLQVAD